MSDKFKAAFDSETPPEVPGASKVFGEKPVVPRRQKHNDLAVLPFQDGQISFGKYRITPIGLDITGELTLEEWENIGQTIRQVNQALPWLVGDLMVYGNRVWGKTYEDVARLVGRSVKTVYNWANIVGSIEFSRRRETLHFSHHALVAPFDAETQSEWLDFAIQHHLSVHRLDAKIKEAAGEKDPTPTTSPRQIFNRIWSASQKGKPINRDQIEHLRQWLDELERKLEG